MKRWTSSMLGVLILLSLFSCASDTADDVPDASVSTTQPGVETTVEPEVTERRDKNGFLCDDLPTDLQFGGQKVTTLYWKDVEHTEFFVESQTGDLIEDSIHTRNRTVEERLGVKLDYIGIAGNVSNIAKFVAQVQNSVSANDQSYDIIGSYSSTAGTLAYSHLVQDLSALPYLDFTRPWWPQTMVDTATIGNSLYFCSGDISTNYLHMMYAVFINKSIAEDMNLTIPYKMVEEGKWTLEEFTKMTANVYGDLNGNSVKDDADRHGFATYNLHLDGLFYGCNLPSVEKGEDGRLKISAVYGSEKTKNLLEILNNNFWNNQDWYFLTASGAAKMQQTIFAEGRSLFMVERVRVSQNKLRNYTLDYGILPMPKYDLSQENYITCLGMPYTLYTIPIDAKAPDVSAAVLECLGSEGYRQVTPNLFEVALKVRYASDEQTTKMYDIVRECVQIDLGRIFNESLKKIPNATLRNLITANQSDWMSTYASIRDNFNALLDDINDAMLGAKS